MGATQGVVVAQGDKHISHLFFFNNSILFCWVNQEEWSNIKSIVRVSEKGLGQATNDQKSLVYFSSNTAENDIHLVVNDIGTELAPI